MLGAVTCLKGSVGLLVLRDVIAKTPVEVSPWPIRLWLMPSPSSPPCEVSWNLEASSSKAIEAPRPRFDAVGTFQSPSPPTQLRRQSEAYLVYPWLLFTSSEERVAHPEATDRRRRLTEHQPPGSSSSSRRIVAEGANSSSLKIVQTNLASP